MKKISNDDPPCLKDAHKWDPSFVDFIKSCLVKDPRLRPDAENVIKINKKFFSLAKNKQYLKENLLKDVPTVHDRVIFTIINIFLNLFKIGKNVRLPDQEEIKKEEDQIEWNFDGINDTDINLSIPNSNSTIGNTGNMNGNGKTSSKYQCLEDAFGDDDA